MNVIVHYKRVLVGLCHTEHVRTNCPYMIDTNIPQYGITSKDAGGTANNLGADSSGSTAPVWVSLSETGNNQL